MASTGSISGAQLARPRAHLRQTGFRRDAHGKFLWPGTAMNLRVLAWMLDRCAGKAGASESGRRLAAAARGISTPGTHGCGSARRPADGDAGCGARKSHELARVSGRFGSRLPAALLAELASTEQRLPEAAAGRSAALRLLRR